MKKINLIKCNYFMDNILQEAFFKRNFNIIKILIQDNRINVSHQNSCGRMILHIIWWFIHSKLNELKLLLYCQINIDLNIKDKYNKTVEDIIISNNKI